MCNRNQHKHERTRGPQRNHNKEPEGGEGAQEGPNKDRKGNTETWEMKKQPPNTDQEMYKATSKITKLQLTFTRTHPIQQQNNEK